MIETRFCILAYCEELKGGNLALRYTIRWETSEME